MAKRNRSDDKKKPSSEKYISLESKGRILQILLAVAIFMHLVDLSLGFVFMLIPQTDDGRLYKMLLDFDVFGTAIASIAAGIMVLVWMGQAFTNLSFLNVKTLGKKNLECYWGWFIPFANFVIPVSAMQDIWKASDPSVTDPKTWRNSKSSILIYTWWFSHLATSVLGVVSRFQAKADPMIQFALGVGLDIMYSVAVLQLIFVVRDIGARQLAKKSIFEASDSIPLS